MRSMVTEMIKANTIIVLMNFFILSLLFFEWGIRLINDFEDVIFCIDVEKTFYFNFIVVVIAFPFVACQFIFFNPYFLPVWCFFQVAFFIDRNGLRIDG